MLKIAITGNIASGKSLVSDFVKSLGGVVISCDEINKNLLNEKSYIKKIATHFPACVKDGVVDKAMLRKEAFSSQENLKLLNSLAHPRIKKKVQKFFNENKNLNCVYVEVPLLFETGMEKLFDRIWLVTVPYQTALERAKLRDNVGEEYVKKVISNQKSFEVIPKEVTDVLINDKGKEELFEHVKKKFVPSVIKRYTHLFIDLDNTILDFNKGEKNALKCACKEFGLKISDEDCAVYNRINREEWEKFERNEIEKKDILVNRYKNFLAYKNATGDPLELNELYKNNLAMQAIYIKGAKEGIKKLAEKYTLCLVSNGTDFVQKSRLKISGLDKILHYTFVSDEIKLSKPNKEFFDYCLNFLKVEKENVLVIGDSNTSDMKGAYVSGLDALFYDYYGSECEYPHIASVSSWKELLKFLNV